MFESTDWVLEESGKDSEKFDKMMPTVVRPRGEHKFVDLENMPLEIGICRQFAFTSSLARMSVIVRTLGGPHFTVYYKGAPEKMEELCEEGSLPEDFHSKLRELTLGGYRVIALACKDLDQRMNWVEIQKMKRGGREWPHIPWLPSHAKYSQT